MKYPLLPVALCYTGGLLLAEVIQPSLLALFAVTFAALAAVLLVWRARSVLLWPLVFLVGWTNAVCRCGIISPDDLRAKLGDSATVAVARGRLSETPKPRAFERNGREIWRAHATMEVSEVRRKTDWERVSGRVAVTAAAVPGKEFFAGQSVEITGVLAPPSEPAAEGLFDYRAYLARQGIYYLLKTETTNDWQVIEPRRTSAPMSDRFLAWARTVLGLGLDREDEALRLERALTLGDRWAMSEEMSEPFVRAATYHIFAVDGLRLGIVFGIFFSLFRAVRLPRVVCGPLLVPLIWFYTALTGWPASAVRAAVMLTVIIVGWTLKRPSAVINSLFAAALIILFWDPRQLFQAGFQLSFVVVLCITLALPVFDEITRRLLRADPLLPEALRPRWQKRLQTPARVVLDLLFTSFAAWIGSLPLVAFYFNIITPVSTPANLVAVPLCALVLASNLISLALAPWFAGGAAVFTAAGWFLMECIRATSVWFARWPGAYWYVRAPGFFAAGLYYLVLLGVLSGWLFRPRLRGVKLAGLLLLSSLWCAQWIRGHSAAELTVLPLNGGHAVYVDGAGPTGRWLIDCGSASSVEYLVKPFLRAHGVNHLPACALTHGDARYIGGFDQLEAAVGVETIYASPAPFRSPVYREILAERQDSNGRRHIVKRGDRPGGWSVLHPDIGDNFAQADDNALVLLGDFYGARILLLSNLGRAGQSALLERTPDLRADVVVSGLPTRGEPLSDSLLAAIQPKVVIVADSGFGSSERASPALRERLAAKGIPVLYTRTCGAVTLTARASHWSFKTMDGQQGSFQAAGRKPGSG